MRLGHVNAVCGFVAALDFLANVEQKHAKGTRKPATRNLFSRWKQITSDVGSVDSCFDTRPENAQHVPPLPGLSR